MIKFISWPDPTIHHYPTIHHFDHRSFAFFCHVTYIYCRRSQVLPAGTEPLRGGPGSPFRVTVLSPARRTCLPAVLYFGRQVDDLSHLRLRQAGLR